MFFFNIFNDYSSSFALAFVLFLELMLICYIYGWREYVADLRTMFGWPKNKFTAIFGATGHYVSFIWRFVAPLQSAVWSKILAVTGEIKTLGDLCIRADDSNHIRPHLR